MAVYNQCAGSTKAKNRLEFINRKADEIIRRKLVPIAIQTGGITEVELKAELEKRGCTLEHHPQKGLVGIVLKKQAA